jgi:hypothetical protein
MANEISISLSVACTKNGATVTGTGSNTITMAGDQFLSNVQIVGTSSEAIVVGDVSTVGFVFCKNLDATNYVEVSLDNSQVNLVAKLLAGESCLFKPGTTTLFAKANTSACNLQVVLLEL